MNQQREVIYDLRLCALEGGEDLKGEIWEMIEHSVEEVLDEYLDHEYSDEIDLEALKSRLALEYFTVISDDQLRELDPLEIGDVVLGAVRQQFENKIDGFGSHSEAVSSYIMLSMIDSKWKDHLYDLDHLKASIGFRGWGQKDPLVEYKKEAYDMFVDLIGDLKRSVANLTFKAQIGPPPASKGMSRSRNNLNYSGPTGEPNKDPDSLSARNGTGQKGSQEEVRLPPGISDGQFGNAQPKDVSTNRSQEKVRTPVTSTKNPGRNDPCPCGSKKKYKKCCGKGVA